MKIYKYPADVLQGHAAPVSTKGEARKLEKQLRKAIVEVEYGHPVGMAAPQIGKPYRAFIANGVFYLNPVILSHGDQITVCREGCYSLEKGVRYEVARWDTIVAIYQDANLEFHRDDLSGFQAEVYQHELDHLIGVSALIRGRYRFVTHHDGAERRRMFEKMVEMEPA